MTQKKNKIIVIFINTAWNIYNFRLQLLRELQEQGFRIVAIAPRDRYSDKIEKAGFEYHAINMNNMGTNPVEDLRLIVTLFNLYRKIQPDLALHYTIKPNIYGAIAAKLAGVPVISTITGLGTVFLDDSTSSKLAQLLYRFSLRIPRIVFFQNPHDLDHFVHQRRLVSESIAALLPGSGIDPQRFQPVNYKKQPGRPFVFLLIARMLRDKGVVEFVEAAQAVLVRNKKRLNQQQGDVEFWLVGSFYSQNPTAIDEKTVDEWTQQNEIKYLGETDGVMHVISRSDCVVLPSYREGLSRVLLEASSMAKPLITTDVPGCMDVVDDGVNGFLCKVKDIPSLTEQMEKMLYLSESERVEMGKAGRKKVLDEFSEKFVIDKYIDVIKEIVGEPDRVEGAGSLPGKVSNEKLAYLPCETKSKR